MRARLVLEMAVNTDDKYYASPELVEHVVDTAIEVIGKDKIKKIVEPSAGDGAFINKLDSLGIPVEYYDKYPEHDRIIQKSFEELNLPYEEGRLFIGGPPYGPGSWLYLMFLRHAAKMGGYIAFISPPRFYNENPYPKFLEILHSELLEEQIFYGSKVRNEQDVLMKSCFNIYKVEHGRKVQPNPKIQQLDQDFFIGQYEKRSETGERSRVPRKYDYYVSNWGNDLGNWYTDPKQTKATSIGIQVKNKSLERDLEEFLDEFRETYYEMFKRLSTNAPLVQVEKFKRILADYLY